MGDATVASKVPFHEVAGLLERISNKQGTDNKKRLLKQFVDHWREFHNNMHKDSPNVNDSFYPAMRLMVPQLEREREAYGIKEHTLAKLYTEILGLGKDSPAAQKLVNYRKPQNARADAGDFASVAFWILKTRCPEKGTMTVEEVNNCLTQISLSNAAKNKDGVKKNLLHMLRNMSAKEQKWLIRMVFKELKTGISQQSVLSVFHQDAEDLFNVKMSLEKVCKMLHDPTVRMHEIEVSLFSPFRPMLGDRGAPAKIEKLMNNKPFLLETKYDGERMQLHTDGKEFKYFSRSGNDYTSAFGASEFDGTFTQYISDCFKSDVKNCILDGEMVGYNPDTQTIGSKGMDFDIKAHQIKEFQPMFCVFDVLLLNDQVLSNKTLRERKEVMKTIFTPIEGRIVYSKHTEGRTRQDCADALNEAIDGREEGIMVKDPDSPYRPNTRKGGWYKIKPEYVGGLMDQLDLLVVGGYFGVGSRSHLMSHFLCAVAVPPSPGEKPSKFLSFCRVGSGYNLKELYDFNARLKSYWQVYDKRRPPAHLVLPSGHKQRPDCWIEPSKSCILQIKAAEVIDSDQFEMACTLRFPRVEKIRSDKPWSDCMTSNDIEELRQKSEGKLAGRHVTIDENEDEPVKKRRKVVTRNVKPSLAARFRGVDASEVQKVSEILADKEICVVNGTDKHSKTDLEKNVVQFGGTVVQHPGENSFCVLAHKITLKVRNIIAKSLHDVVKADWLVTCVDASKFIPWVPADMLYTTKETSAKFALDYDEYGDSYYDDCTPDSLQKAFSKIDKLGSLECLESEDIAEMEQEYFPQDSPYGLFRLSRVYLDSNLVIGEQSTPIKNCPLDGVGLAMRFHGATLTTKLDSNTSHVVIDSRDLSRVKSFREVNKSRKKKFHVVTEDWATDCIENEALLGERDYEPAS